MTDLNDAVVLVTGASGGFGRQMTRQFIEAGSRLLLTDIDPHALETLRQEFDGSGKRILGTVAANLVDDAGCRKLFDDIRSLGFEPDILVNNAGIAVGGRFDHVPSDRWEQVIQVNLLAPMRICYLFLPRMIERGRGHIVNISSIAGWVGSMSLSSYSATKFGLRGFADSLASDYEEHGIRVSTVYPCFSRTPILDSDQFGFESRREVPDDMLTDPVDVVAEIIKGVKRDRRDIFPDKLARRIYLLKRFAPGILSLFERRLQDRILAEE